MKLTYTITAAIIAYVTGAHELSGAIISSFSGSEGAPYRYSVILGATDSGEVIRRVGAWAWEDKSLFGASGTETVGWTHNSEWFGITLESDVLLTIRVQNREDVVDTNPMNPTGLFGGNLFPAFTILSGWDIDSEASHFYENQKDIGWADDLTYMMHAGPNGSHVNEVTVPLSAGIYTLVVGGNSTSDTNEGFQGYQANFTTAPVPEPGSMVLALAGGLGLLVHRRRAPRSN